VSWGRVNGLRAMELGRPGESRRRLNDYVLHGEKRATAGLLALDYEAEGEPLEQVGELLALTDDKGEPIATLRVTDVVVRRFADVPWEFAQAEGEGFTSIEHWRDGHRGHWSRDGVAVEDATRVVCVQFDLVEVGPSVEAVVPGQAQDLVDRLEEEIVDVDRAAGAGGSTAEDTATSVPGAPEPTD
jgi:uncharacterized protein YhfF